MSAAAAGAAPGPCRAEGEDNAFTIEFRSPGWKVKKEVREAIRVRKEKVFEAAGATSGATVTLTRSPLGADRTAAEKRERLLELAGAFDPKRQTNIPSDEIVKILTLSFDDPDMRRERQWLGVRRRPGVEERLGPLGQRYIGFSYDLQECSGKVTAFTREDGTNVEDCDGKVLPWRRHYVAATVIPTKYTSMRSSSLDGSSGMMSRLLETLWLLDASAPAAKVDSKGSLGAELEAVARSFTVALAELPAEAGSA